MQRAKLYIIDRIEISQDGCWLWKGIKDADGYGRVPARSRVCKMLGYHHTHRISYTLFNGQIPDGLVVRHTCRSRHCCNPDHLEVGTVYDNNQDKFRDNTNPHILEAQEVLKIRELYATGTYTIKGLAEQYGMSWSAIDYVIRRKTWKHI